MQPARLHARFAIPLLVPVLLLAGCATSTAAIAREDPAGKKPNPRLHREHVMQAAWRGQPYHSLLEKLGPPRLVMTHPAHRFGHGEIVIYGVQDLTSNCIDAFTVIAPNGSQEPMVADYFCR